MARIHAEFGVRFTPVALGDLAAVTQAWRPETRLVWVESPTNPLLSIVDIAAVADSPHRGALLAVDNTFATPYLQRPLVLGADVVVHSTTKYLCGHSDVVGGFLATADAAAGRATDLSAERRRGRSRPVRLLPHPAGRQDAGRAHGPPLRQRRRRRRAAPEHPRVDRVNYPGLPDHPGHAVAARQMRGFGGMVSFAVAGGRAGRPAGRQTDAPVHPGRIASARSSR